MLQEFNIARSSRRCHRSGRELRPGEEYYSAIVRREGDLEREDIAAESWEGVPPDAIGWWRQKMPLGGQRKLRPAPDGVLLETLSELVEKPGKESLAYLLALLLVRRRILVDADDTHIGEQLNRFHEAGNSLSVWHLTLPADGRQWQVPTMSPNAEECESIQNQLTSLLFIEE